MGRFSTGRHGMSTGGGTDRPRAQTPVHCPPMKRREHAGGLQAGRRLAPQHVLPRPPPPRAGRLARARFSSTQPCHQGNADDRALSRAVPAPRRAGAPAWSAPRRSPPPSGPCALPGRARPRCAPPRSPARAPARSPQAPPRPPRAATARADVARCARRDPSFLALLSIRSRRDRHSPDLYRRQPQNRATQGAPTGACHKSNARRP